MKRSTRFVLFAAVLFAVAMGALSEGGWWWAWLAVLLFIALRRRVPLTGTRLSPSARFLIRENRRSRRHNRRLAAERRRRIRDQQRAMRSRRRQAQ